MTAPADTLANKALFVAAMAVWAFAIFALIIVTVRTGHPVWAVVSTLLASIVPMFILGMAMEGRRFSELASLKVGSWAFLLGDLLWLPLMAGAAAVGWRYLDRTEPHWYTSVWWVLASALFGVAAAVGFHTMDSANYRRAGAALALESPTKLYHDFGAYSILAGSLFCVGVPLVVAAASGLLGGMGFTALTAWALVALVGLLLWLAMGAADANRGLDPKNLHP